MITDTRICTASYSVSDQFGRVAVSFDTYASCTYGNAQSCGPSVSGLYHCAEADFGATFNYGSDGIEIGTVPGGSGLLEVQHLMQGTIGGGGGFTNGVIQGFLGDLTNPNTVVFDVGLTVCPYLCNDPNTSPYFQQAALANGSTMFTTLMPDNSLADTWDYSVYGTMIIPISSNSSIARPVPRFRECASKRACPCRRSQHPGLCRRSCLHPGLDR